MRPTKSKNAIKNLSADEMDSAIYRFGRMCYLAGWAAREAQQYVCEDPPLAKAEAGWKRLEVDLVKQFGTGTKHHKSFFSE
jgi:hypothetical protein